MADYRYHEIEEFVVNTHAVEKAEGCWATFVFIERKADLSKDRAPGIRHHLRQDSETEGEAIERGIQYAYECVKKGDTGL